MVPETLVNGWRHKRQVLAAIVMQEKQKEEHMREGAAAKQPRIKQRTSRAIFMHK